MKEDLENYFNGHRISKAMTESILGNRDITENETLNSFLSDDENKKELLDRFSNAEETINRRKKVKNRDKENDLKILQHELEKHNSKRKSLYLKLFALTSSVAAVAVFMILFMNKSEIRLVTNNDLTGNIFVPTLFFDDGNNIALKSENLKIPNVNVKVSANKISYEIPHDDDVVVKYNTLVIPKQYTYNVVLDDGTEIILNAGSQLRYPTVFRGDTREVELVGEAYFKVKKSDIPFIVKVNGIDIKVYGTEFNVRSNNRNGVETVLISGKLGVKAEKYNEVIMLPNTYLNYTTDGATNLLRDIHIGDYVSWLEEVFYYDEQPLSRVLEDMSKWYGISFNFGEKVGDTNVSMNMSRATSVDDAIVFIENLINHKIIKEGKNSYSVE